MLKIHKINMKIDKIGKPKLFIKIMYKTSHLI